MKRLLYILALITTCGSPSVKAEAPMGAHLRADTGYLACVLSKIPEASREKTALLLWPTLIPVDNAGTCGNPTTRLSSIEISELQNTLEYATLSCQSELPPDTESREDATYGLLGVLLINPKTPADTASWENFMAGSRLCHGRTAVLGK